MAQGGSRRAWGSPPSDPRERDLAPPPNKFGPAAVWYFDPFRRGGHDCQKCVFAPQADSLAPGLYLRLNNFSDFSNSSWYVRNASGRLSEPRKFESDRWLCLSCLFFTHQYLES